MTLDQITAEVESLRVNRVRDAARLRAVEEYIDTVSSPLWKRVWFVIQGYRFRRVGRWYAKTAELR